MKTHIAVQAKSSFGGTLTTTLCGRSNAKSTDGFNSDANHAAVTCQHCLAILRDRSHWRARKFLGEAA